MTFTVQTKSQGAEWQNVSHCIQISSDSCDLSQAFKDFDLYKHVMLGLNQGHGKINWTEPQLCDPIKDANARFSPPSVSISLKEQQQLWVNVNFPCAPNAVCQGEDEEAPPTCCPLTDFLELNTTVILYNKHMTENQTRTEMVEGHPLMVQFGGLVRGQEYCTVAHFASSPLSKPQCVHIPLLGPSENRALFVLALCGAFIALLLVAGFVLRRWLCWCASTDLRFPKSLVSFLSQDQEGPVVDEPRQADFEEEELIVHLSIISLNDVLPSDPHSFYPHLHGLGVRYYSTAILSDQFCNGDEDTGYHSRDVETDGVADCGSPAHYPWTRWSSLPALRTGMVCLLGNFIPSEGSGIPLSSVRVAGDQITKMESDHSFKVLPSLYSDLD
ncbi:uncharacterized protein si:dkeyp-75h12.7 isoform X2 [Neoarius graeffei]|nr:uncharacterized protein si:dkeyp-75h12.7 isoform X2 [Neoarius graeffei]